MNEIVTNSGSISASWVLVIVSCIAGSLALLILNDIRSTLRSIVNRVNEQGVDLAKAKERTEYAHERIDDLKAAINKA